MNFHQNRLQGGLVVVYFFIVYYIVYIIWLYRDGPGASSRESGDLGPSLWAAAVKRARPQVWPLYHRK